MYLLITIIFQNGLYDTFYEPYKTNKACLKAKTETLRYNNELTKVTAYCIKQSN